MTSQNNTLFSQRGSALIVTMLLVSVLLATALILLQRIVPYAKSVRSMHEASEAYYVARGQTDLARLNFLYNITPIASLKIPSIFGLLSQTNTSGAISATGDNERDDTSSTGLTVIEDTVSEYDDPEVSNNGSKIIRIGSAFTNANGERTLNINEAYAVVSKSSEMPLKIKLNPNDTETRYFGTSKTNQAYHTLNPLNAGGLRFDLRGVNTNTQFALSMKFSTVAPDTKITLKIQHEKTILNDTTITTFTGEFSPPSNSGLSLTASLWGGNVQQIAPSGDITAFTQPFAAFLNANNCNTADICSLIFTMSDASPSVDFQLLSTNTKIPDLNAIVIGDGLSGNGLYYQRIIDLIPTPQDI